MRCKIFFTAAFIPHSVIRNNNTGTAPAWQVERLYIRCEVKRGKHKWMITFLRASVDHTTGTFKAHRCLWPEFFGQLTRLELTYTDTNPLESVTELKRCRDLVNHSSLPITHLKLVPYQYGQLEVELLTVDNRVRFHELAFHLPNSLTCLDPSVGAPFKRFSEASNV